MNTHLTREHVALITGASAGIGKVTAAALAGMGVQIVLAGRNPGKTHDAAEEIRAAVRAAGGRPQVEALLADFSDLDAVRRLADDFRRRYARLDVLVNNAGAYFNRRRLSPEGVEMTFLVNHLAPFTLTTALLDLLSASEAGRIVNVASAGHVYAAMDFDDLFFARRYFGMQAYARSKLANILFTYELARRLDGVGVSANAMHPGLVTTDIWRNEFPVIGPALKWLVGLRGLTPEQGADTIIYLAASPDVVGVSGKYFVKRQAVASSPASYDEATQRRLWELSERLAARPRAERV